MIQKYFLFIILFATIVQANQAQPAYNGSTGLLETPNARIMKDWNARFFLNRSEPFNYYGITITPYPFMELNLHMTKVDTVHGTGTWAGYGAYKDKAINIKLLLNKESEFLPSVVFGAEDIWGTALFSSKYIAFSKRFKDFDFTVGYAKGRLGGEDLSKFASSSNSGGIDNSAVNFLKDSKLDGGKFFGGIEYYATNKLTLQAEYSPIDYKKDKLNALEKDSKSNFNFGLRYLVSKNLSSTLSYQRGNQLSYGLNYQFAFDRTGMFDHIPDKKWKASLKKRDKYKTYDKKTLSDKLAHEISLEKFRDVSISLNKNKVWCELENSRYHHDVQAIGRAVGVITQLLPSSYDTYYMNIKHHNTTYKTMKVKPNSSTISRDTQKSYKEFSDAKNIYKSKNYGEKKFSYYIKPTVATFLNAKDKPFSMKISAEAGFSYDFDTNGLFISGAIIHPLYNSIKDIKATNDNPEDTRLALNSSIIDYSRYDSTQMKKLVLDYIFKTPYNSFSKIEIGYLNYIYAGVDLEWFKPIYDDKFGIGLEYQKVYKRRVNNILKVYNDLIYDAKFLNLYYFLSPKYDTHLNLKVGQFLAGDKGVKVNIERNYKNFTIGAYATVTNSNDIFTSADNRGYIDKGIYLKVPLEIFTYKNEKQRVSYGISPWSRDVGQYSATTYSLSGMLSSENNLRVMSKNIELIGN